MGLEDTNRGLISPSSPRSRAAVGTPAAGPWLGTWASTLRRWWGPGDRIAAACTARGASWNLRLAWVLGRVPSIFGVAYRENRPTTAILSLDVVTQTRVKAERKTSHLFAADLFAIFCEAS